MEGGEIAESEDFFIFSMELFYYCLFYVKYLTCLVGACLVNASYFKHLNTTTSLFFVSQMAFCK